MGYADFKVTADIVRKRTQILLNGDDFRGIKTGFADLDTRISGFRDGDLILVGGRPSMGKTAFALNLLENMAIEGEQTCLYFSMEVSAPMLIERLIKEVAQVGVYRKHIPDDEQRRKISEAARRMEECRILIDDTPGLSVEELAERIRHYGTDHDIDFILVDYLQLLHSEPEADSCKCEMDAIMERLKCVAREMDCPVLILSQIGRSVERRKNHRPLITDLKESDSICSYADVIIFLYRDEYYDCDSKRKGIMELIVAKDIMGYPGTLELGYRSDCCKLSNLTA